MKVAIYCRVSTDEQKLENQMPALEAWCKSNNAEIARIYSENDTAWKLNHQAELARLLDDIRSGRYKYDCLLVWSLDRLTRQGIISMITLVNSLKAYGVRVISISEPFTQADPAIAELMYSVFAWIAKQESQHRSERIKAGMARKKKNGEKVGRPKGAKDNPNKPRRKSGYYIRWAGKQASGKKTANL